MATSRLRVEDKLDGGENRVPWRARIVLLLEECELLEIVESVVTLPIDPIVLAEFKKNVKAKRIILDLVKDHIIPHVSSRDYAYLMWESLSNLYQSSNQNRKMVFPEKLRSTRMAKGESITYYLTRVSQVRYELAAVGKTIDSAECFSKSWETFVCGIVARENMPSWERLWDDCVQEELRVGSSSSSVEDGGEEDTVALAAKGEKKKTSKKGPKEGGRKRRV